MGLRLRRAGMLVLLVLMVFSLPIRLTAQEADSAATIVGSGIAAPLVDALVAASGAAVNYDLTVTGTSPGIEAFCQGEADVAMATRPLTEQEALLCTNNGVEFHELLIGYDVLAFIAHPETDFAQCLTSDQLNTMLIPSAAGQVTDWSQISADYAATPLTIVLPPATSASYAQIDERVEGVGLRADLTTLPTAAAITTAVRETPGAFGAVDLSAALAAGDTL
ncbi:MAG: hypothetical protein GYB67_12140, partial [Chloroflexi bacterium]|nr:hypothetical protein [Chloroflexota bacterium]